MCVYVLARVRSVGTTTNNACTMIMRAIGQSADARYHQFDMGETMVNGACIAWPIIECLSGFGQWEMV